MEAAIVALALFAGLALLAVALYTTRNTTQNTPEQPDIAAISVAVADAVSTGIAAGIRASIAPAGEPTPPDYPPPGPPVELDDEGFVIADGRDWTDDVIPDVPRPVDAEAWNEAFGILPVDGPVAR